MDKNDLDALLASAPAEEVDRIHRLLHEWSVGPDSSFPVQLALLTKAQWLVAASIPRSVNDSRKLIEQHLAQYQQETAALVKNLSTATTEQAEKLEEIVAAHKETVNQASVSIRNHLWETQEAAKRITNSLDIGASEWNRAKAGLVTECKKLQEVCRDLDNRVAWRQLLWFGVGFALAFFLGIVVGHYRIH